MTSTEKAAKVAPYLQNLCTVVIHELIARLEGGTFKSVTVGDIQEQLSPLLEDINNKDHEAFMLFASLAISQMIHRKIQLDMERLEREGGE